MSDFPISHLYELGRLGQAGDVVTLAPSDEDRARIAQWADVDAVERFTATIDLKKVTPTRYAFDATLAADIVQSCVVTLDPVRSHIERSFHRDLFLTQAKPSLDLEVAPVDEDGREEIASLRYDLAVPVLEELALAIDPYPRAPGVEFAPPADSDEPIHPFAALKALKRD
ncbi:MAG TPA: DUF177 domain-containing protein [Rhizomicrobium sp.]|nr:DUF177 domain-containing protein [Rhizomicrobium sp.]